MATTAAQAAPEPYQYTSYKDQWSSGSVGAASGSSRRWNSPPLSQPTVFGLCFWKSPQSALWLLACTSQGQVYVWKTPRSFLQGDQGQGTEQDDSIFSDLEHYQKPFRQWKVAKGVLYCIQMITNNDKDLLMVSGEEGVLIFDWDTLRRAPSSHNNNNTSCPAPTARFQPHPSPLESHIEINHMAYSPKGNCVYGAAGDAFGGYKWNLDTQQLVRTYQSPGKGALQTLHMSSSSSLLLTGGQDGTVGIWDTQHDRMIDQIHVNALEATSTPTTPKNNKRKAPPHRARWIGSIVGVQDVWWTIGGGSDTNNYLPTTTRNSTGDAGGFVATFHEPTRSLVAMTETSASGECIHQLAYHKDRLLAVGNSGLVSHMDPFSLERPRQTWCSTACGFAIATAPDESRVAVGGVGPSIDLLEDQQVVFRFYLA